MYLSRLILNERHPQARRDLGSGYAIHQSLRWAFPGAGEPGTPLPDGERVLWRNEGRGYLLVQSQTEPNWGALTERHPGYLETAETRLLHLSGVLTAGRHLRFRLQANPTVTRKDDRTGKPKRFALYGAREALAWLDRQGERGGFTVLRADILQTRTVCDRKPGSTRPLTLHAVTFDGLLQVEDPERLAHTVRQGIGHGKALGFGLLSLAGR
ncbi:type I-E CRISPR-associated protein Cas6/Cse3/CasE [Deinococcus sp. YIM 77859]|uniref:type I-E CRISPR-associated protein Cas6/Cse3/CasE n=1 Tax=Deinococcus sp. YIM 77859 TaxID=1540221 RepID=UPI000553B580|nr:type I-E CRISPR-associated protein Cas6/Cse3/CasE [Deinococcus sp. YIM 77859]